MTAPNDSLDLRAAQGMNAYLNGLVTRQAQTIDELLTERDAAQQLIASMLAGHVPGLTTAADLTSTGAVDARLSGTSRHAPHTGVPGPGLADSAGPGHPQGVRS